MSRRVLLALFTIGVIAASAVGAQFAYDRTLGSQSSDAILMPPASINGGALATDAVLVVWSGEGTGADEFEVFRDGVAIANTNLLSFTDFNMEPGTTYTYRVRAGDGDRWSELSDTIELTTEPEPR